MEIKDRILEYIKYKKITIKEFEEKSNMSNGYISSMRKGLGDEKLKNVLSSFPDLNRDWLLFGEGQMIKGEQKSDEVVSDTITIPREAWAVIQDQAASLKAKDESLRLKDEQTAMVIEMLKEQMKQQGEASAVKKSRVV